MAIPPILLDILVCPETKQPLSLAAPDVVEQINQKIAAGSLVNRGGNVVTGELTAALRRSDGKYLYPVRDDIPVMLVEESFEPPLSSN